MKDRVWVLVANGSTARLFQAANGVTSKLRLEEVETFEHPQSRAHGRDLVTERAGRVFDSIGTGRHAMEPPIKPQRNEANHFAEELAKHLEQSRKNGAYSKLYLVVSPSFLGMLRGALPDQTKELIASEVDKDVTNKTPEEIRSYLPFRL